MSHQTILKRAVATHPESKGDRIPDRLSPREVVGRAMEALELLGTRLAKFNSESGLWHNVKALNKPAKEMMDVINPGDKLYAGDIALIFNSMIQLSLRAPVMEEDKPDGSKRLTFGVSSEGNVTPRAKLG